MEADEILVSIGRTPRTADLGLETVGLEPGKHVRVDDSLRVEGSDWLYAVGDVNGRALLTHMGKYQARLAADAILGKQVQPALRRRGVAARDLHRSAGGRRRPDAGGRRGGRARGACRRRRDRRQRGRLVHRQGRARDCPPRRRRGARRRRRAPRSPAPRSPRRCTRPRSPSSARSRSTTLWHAVPAFPTRSELWLRLLEAYGLLTARTRKRRPWRRQDTRHMRLADDGTLTLSPSDLSAHLACEHLTTLSLRVARGELAPPVPRVRAPRAHLPQGHRARGRVPRVARGAGADGHPDPDLRRGVVRRGRGAQADRGGDPARRRRT